MPDRLVALEHRVVPADGDLPPTPPVLAVLRPEIGGWSDERVVLSGFSEAPSGVGGLLESAGRDVLCEPLPGEGIYALRWFEVAASNWEEFLDLSVSAWPSFEANNPGCRVLALFRRLADAAERLDALLVTNYPGHGAWDRSRTYEAEPPAGTDPDAYGRSRDAFRRRHQLTMRTSVSTWRVVSR